MNLATREDVTPTSGPLAHRDILAHRETLAPRDCSPPQHSLHTDNSSTLLSHLAPRGSLPHEDPCQRPNPLTPSKSLTPLREPPRRILPLLPSKRSHCKTRIEKYVGLYKDKSVSSRRWKGANYNPMIFWDFFILIFRFWNILEHFDVWIFLEAMFRALSFFWNISEF